MLLKRARQLDGQVSVPHTQAVHRGTPAVIVAPVPPGQVRAAMPGERPASRFAPGEHDDIGERFDAWITGGMRHG